VTYGGDDGDGLVDNNNALTTMASALKSVLMETPPKGISFHQGRFDLGANL
jgi:hypothetical protein